MLELSYKLSCLAQETLCLEVLPIHSIEFAVHATLRQRGSLRLSCVAKDVWSHGTGADVKKRIAAPMVGGMVTSTALTLVVIPAIYFLRRTWELTRAP